MLPSQKGNSTSPGVKHLRMNMDATHESLRLLSRLLYFNIYGDHMAFSPLSPFPKSGVWQELENIY